MRAEPGRAGSDHLDEIILYTAHLRQLWYGLERTQTAIVTSAAAYRESQELLRRVEAIEGNGRGSADDG